MKKRNLVITDRILNVAAAANRARGNEVATTRSQLAGVLAEEIEAQSEPTVVTGRRWRRWLATAVKFAVAVLVVTALLLFGCGGVEKRADADDGAAVARDGGAAVTLDGGVGPGVDGSVACVPLCRVGADGSCLCVGDFGEDVRCLDVAPAGTWTRSCCGRPCN